MHDMASIFERNLHKNSTGEQATEKALLKYQEPKRCGSKCSSHTVTNAKKVSLKVICIFLKHSSVWHCSSSLFGLRACDALDERFVTI